MLWTWAFGGPSLAEQQIRNHLYEENKFSLLQKTSPAPNQTNPAVTQTISYCYDELHVTADTHNRIHATGAPDYQYDAAGNMTFNATPPTQGYTWDAENRLTGAAGYAYIYDGDGNRVRKANGNTASSGTLYWYMTPGVVAESDLAGTLKSEYIFFDGERGARKDFPGNTIAYYFSDHLKTASVITDAAGAITAESDYYPWGGELPFVSNDSNHFKYTGKERDGETGNDYYGARYYASVLGRWTSSDWSAAPVPVPYADLSDPQSLNLYAYIRNVPTSRADLDGHQSTQAIMQQAPRVAPLAAACLVAEPCGAAVATARHCNDTGCIHYYPSHRRALDARRFEPSWYCGDGTGKQSISRNADEN
jgi:RHS repeat-associated protein